MGPPHLRVLEGPSALAFRVAHGLAWLLKFRPEFEYVAYFSDRTFVHVPRLFDQILQHANPSLAMGSLTELPLTAGHADLDQADLRASGSSSPDCETCPNNPEHEKLCLKRIVSVPSGVDYRGCLRILRQCCEGKLAACEGMAMERCLD